MNISLLLKGKSNLWALLRAESNLTPGVYSSRRSGSASSSLAAQLSSDSWPTHSKPLLLWQKLHIERLYWAKEKKLKRHPKDRIHMAAIFCLLWLWLNFIKLAVWLLTFSSPSLKNALVKSVILHDIMLTGVHNQCKSRSLQKNIV